IISTPAETRAASRQYSRGESRGTSREPFLPAIGIFSSAFSAFLSYFAYYSLDTRVPHYSCSVEFCQAHPAPLHAKPAVSGRWFFTVMRNLRVIRRRDPRIQREVVS